MQTLLTINTPQVISEIFDEEAVVAHLSNGVYYHITGAGVPIWQWIGQGLPEEQIATFAKQTFAEPDLAAITAFLAELEKEELLKRTNESAPNGGSVSQPIPFAPPVMQRFTDMQELLLLDPIHEVNDEGWPHKPE